MKKLAGSVLMLLALAAALPAQGTAITAPLRFDQYYPLDQVYEALQALHKAYPRLTTLETVGRSDEGRPIMAMTVVNPKTGAALDKPGMYVDGNMHGNEIQGGDISLYLLDYLLGNYGKNPEVTALVDKACFYVVPVVNVDGRYHFFADANTPDSSRTLRIPTDDDHDGLLDEDPPEDLDGDGNICTMRKKDPFGQYRTDPEEPRLMVRVKPGEKGEWTLLGDEGLDNDGDGQVNEDEPGYVDGNRNWGFDWAPPYVQSGSGDFPFSGSGLKALAEWTMTKPNICFAWSFHNNGGMFLRGPSRKGLGEYPPQDVAVYDFLGKQGERIIPGYRYLISWKDLYSTYGDSGEWMTQTMGAYFYCAEVFQTESETFKGASERPEEGSRGEEAVRDIFGGSSDRERLKYSDNVVQGELYKPWKPFQHPVYGDIEIGGWAKMSSRLGAPFMIKDLVHRNAMAVLFSAKHLPDVALDVFEVKPLGGGLYRVRTRLSNPKALPTMSYLAQRARLYPQDTLTVGGPGAKVVAGGPLLDPYTDQVAYAKARPELQFLVVPGFGKVEHQFLVQGKGEITVRFASRHGGKLSKTIKLQ
ncbi:MAG TPA: M14 family metallopeptidase [Candidatus Aminicenantes bacterium]|nr:M14 family metallopeptidase [Candidatus Aminicenantes bacterium]HRY63840.1 M14 family metallopeptidase [Candidatus Aminicenantes bacterium]HRZ70753.1 M14 family metallopeptidase [Candidatus Aminicenantes bacterium]